MIKYPRQREILSIGGVFGGAYLAKDFVMDLRASNAAPDDGWAFQRCLRCEQQGESDLTWDVLRVDQAEMTLTLDGAPVYPEKPQRVVPEKENHS